MDRAPDGADTNTPPPPPDDGARYGDGDGTFDFPWTIAGPFVVEASHGGDGRFVVVACSGDGRTIGSVVETTGGYAGRRLHAGDEHVGRLRIEASGPWRVAVRQMTDAPQWNGIETVTGVGDEVLRIPGGQPTRLPFRFTGGGDGPVLVMTGAGGSTDTELVRSDGEFADFVHLEEGVEFVSVRTDGRWAFTPALPPYMRNWDDQDVVAEALAERRPARGTSAIWRRTGPLRTFRLRQSFGQPPEEGPGGQRIIEFVPPLSGKLVVEMSHEGAGEFRVAAMANATRRIGLLADTAGVWSGRAVCDVTTAVRELVVQADGRWTLRVHRHDRRWEGSAAAQGIGDAVHEFTGPVTSAFVVEADHIGTGRFTLEALGADGDVVSTLVEDDGDMHLRTVYFGDADVSALRVRTDGVWRLNANEFLRHWDGHREVVGTSDATLYVPGGIDGHLPVTFSHRGVGRVTLTTAGPSGEDRLIDTEGAYDGLVGLPPLTRVVTIRAADDWTVTPT